MTQKEQKWLVLLRCLSELNGGAQRSVVLQYINDQGYWCKNDQNDTLRRTRNEMAWRNDFSFERQHLVEYGYMEQKGQGRWAITPSGRALLADLSEKAVRQTAGTDTSYTAAFFRTLVGDTAVFEMEEDQSLIVQLSQPDQPSGKRPLPPLLDIPQPKGTPSTRSGRIYQRSPAVSRRALELAGYRCAVNPDHPSFLCRDGITWYMEPHHLIPMAFTDYFGVNLDREQNIFSLCSHCHNQIHYGAREDVRRLLAKLFCRGNRQSAEFLAGRLRWKNYTGSMKRNSARFSKLPHKKGATGSYLSSPDKPGLAASAHLPPKRGQMSRYLS